MPQAKPKSSSTSVGKARTCTLRTRFASFADLERAVAVLVRDDGRLFVPLAPGLVTSGEPLRLSFTTLNGAAAVNSMAVVESITPEPSISNGHRGVLLRML